MSNDNDQRDHSRQQLTHYLVLAAGQLRRRIQVAEGKESYSKSADASSGPSSGPSLARLRLLEELIKEQMPHEDPGSSARPTR